MYFCCLYLSISVHSPNTYVWLQFEVILKIQVEFKADKVVCKNSLNLSVKMSAFGTRPFIETVIGFSTRINRGRSRCYVLFCCD
jgi:hypothetical protein